MLILTHFKNKPKNKYYYEGLSLDLVQRQSLTSKAYNLINYYDKRCNYTSM